MWASHKPRMHASSASTLAPAASTCNSRTVQATLWPVCLRPAGTFATVWGPQMKGDDKTAVWDMTAVLVHVTTL